MIRATSFIASVSLVVAVLPAVAVADHASERIKAGASGVGDPYFPLDGNGGYDVRHYDLRLAYHPRSDRLHGVVKIRARATKDLPAFHLDFDGLTVESVRVRHRKAGWSRHNGELTVKPRRELLKGSVFTTRVRYGGVPKTLEGDTFLGASSGFFHTNDGAVVAGQPHGASTWFPVNDHPTDKASYAFHINVPRDLKAVANGRLQGRKSHGNRTTWNWAARAPMASYLATMAIGDFKLRAYRKHHLQYFDAIDKDLLKPYAPHSGKRFAISQKANTTYKRLRHVIDVPARGAKLSFWIRRDTEFFWDFAFVEAHTLGQNDWTTLPDANGHSSRDTGALCVYWPKLHPFLRHYLTNGKGGRCTAEGDTGNWWAATGESDGWEKWSIDLSAYAGSTVAVSISYVSDDIFQAPGGVQVDDVVVSTGQGTTSFERDGDTRDGWTVPGAPTGSKPNRNDWIVGTSAAAPPTMGMIAWRSMSHEPEIIKFLSNRFGPYPFNAVGGIVDDEERLTFALETQTRPVYGLGFFTDAASGAGVLVHELAHQWYGDSLAVRRWRHIWLNEGFATYAEWLWSGKQGNGTAQQIFDIYYNAIPAKSSFWNLRIGNPGPKRLFDFAVYYRGAMTLHQLRLKIGDRDFFRTLRTWARSNSGGNVSTREFVTLAERISGQHLGAFFKKWLRTSKKPKIPSTSTAKSASPTPELGTVSRQLQHMTLTDSPTASPPLRR